MVLVKKGTKSVQYFLNYELLFELNEENIHVIGHIFRAKVKRGLLCIDFFICKPEVGSGLNKLVLEGPIQNGVGQLRTGLGHLRA